MNYRVYTDAATKLTEGYSSVAFLVLRGNIFIKRHSEIIHVNNTSVAESYAVSLALEYLAEEVGVNKKDEITVFCDSLYTVKYARKCLKAAKTNNARGNCDRPVNAEWLMGIYDYIHSIESKLTFSKIKAHTKGMNPHCYVDRLAKVGLIIN